MVFIIKKKIEIILQNNKHIIIIGTAIIYC